MLYPLEVDDNETIQQPTPETPIQNSEPEEPIATRTRRATRKRDGTRPISMSITNCFILISLILITIVKTNTAQNCKWISDELQTAFTFKKIEKIKNTTCNFSKPYLMNGDIIIDEGFKQQLRRSCKSRNNLLLLIAWLSTSNPTLAARLLLQRSDIIAKRVDNKLLVASCNPKRHKVINLKTNLPKTESLWTELDQQREELIEPLTVQFEKTAETIEELAHVIARWKLTTISIFGS
ncbi:hypothetical protein LOAG_15360, partial [Loa loa]